MKRIIVIGDVHACIEELDELLRKVQYSAATDRLVFLGDYLDRGPDPVGVVRRVRELNVEAIQGNHCESHVRWRKHELVKAMTGRKNPMKPFTPERAAQHNALTDDDIAWLGSLPLTIQLPNNWVAVHGGFQPHIPIAEQKRNEIIRMRWLDKDTFKPVPLGDDLDQPPNSIFWSTVWAGPQHVLYGHAVVGPRPFHVMNCTPEKIHSVGLDTGCCFGLRLTALVTENEFDSWDYVQVDAKRVYCEPKFNVHFPLNLGAK